MIVFTKDGATETVADGERDRYLENGWSILKEGVGKPRSKGRYDDNGNWKIDENEKELDRLRAMDQPALVEMFRREMEELRKRIEKLEG